MTIKPVSVAHYRKCFTAHLCPWLIWPKVGNALLAQAKEMPWAFKAMDDGDDGDQETPEERENRLIAGIYQVVGSVAVITIDGPMQKFDSSLGGTNTIRLRQVVRMAASNPAVGSILIRADTPGGTVAGTGDLAADVLMAAGMKPVIGYCEDMTASAGYWVLSQCMKIFSNANALVGCIGTVMSVEDTSKKNSIEGIETIVFSTGDYKGAFIDGTPVTPEQRAYAQSLVDGLNQGFLAAVKSGRKMDAAALKAVSDGRCFVAPEAKRLGLIDGIMSFDDVLGMMQTKYPPKAAARRRDQAALAIDVAIAE